MLMSLKHYIIVKEDKFHMIIKIFNAKYILQRENKDYQNCRIDTQHMLVYISNDNLLHIIYIYICLCRKSQIKMLNQDEQKV